MTAPPEGVLELILQQMVSDYESLNQPKEILNLWWADCLHKNQKVQVETTEGVIVGTNVGLDDSGRLLLAAGDGTMRVVAEGSLRLFPQV